MAEHILVTGGAGFIGRHLVRRLLRDGHRVRVMDSLIPQVHGDAAAAARRRPAALEAEAEFLLGDVCDADLLRRALDGVDAVVHLAAEVGVGQSMYAVDRYVAANDLGTATLLQALIERPVRRVVVASSMSIYGEGLYRNAEGRAVEDALRQPRRAPDAPWDPLDATGHPLIPAPTPEWKRPSLASVYAITKFAQERLILAVAPAYGMEAAALRLWNVYGPGQALSNPYTGVLAIFAARLLHRQPPVIFEDGEQRRDFVHVEDVAEAFALALRHPAAVGEVFNIASGADRSVREVAALLAGAMGCAAIAPEITGQARAGDIRHCIADTTKAREVLGFTARRDFTGGLAELAAWVAAQQDAEDRVPQARRELEARGLVA